jgi:hypothetical protein
MCAGLLSAAYMRLTHSMFAVPLPCALNKTLIVIYHQYHQSLIDLLVFVLLRRCKVRTAAAGLK